MFFLKNILRIRIQNLEKLTYCLKQVVLRFFWICASSRESFLSYEPIFSSIIFSFSNIYFFISKFILASLDSIYFLVFLFSLLNISEESLESLSVLFLALVVFSILSQVNTSFLASWSLLLSEKGFFLFSSADELLRRS